MEQAVGATHVARIQPSDTAGCIRLGTMQGGTVMSLRVGRYLYVHGVIKQVSDCDTPKTQCASCLLCVRESNGGNLA